MQKEYSNYLKNLNENTANELYQCLKEYYEAYMDELGKVEKKRIDVAAESANRLYVKYLENEKLEDIRFFFLFGMANASVRYGLIQDITDLMRAIENTFKGVKNEAGTEYKTH